MRQFLCTFALLAAVLPARAADDQPKPNALTPKEIADGWILLFDGETMFGWSVPEGDKWTIKDGLLAPQTGNKGVLLSTTEFGDCELRFEYQTRPGGQAQLLVACDRDVKPQKIEEGATLPPGRTVEVWPLRSLGAGWHRAALTIKSGKIVEERVEAGGGGQGGSGGLVNPKPRRGHLGLAGNGFVVRNLKLRPLGTKPLFNGKDLSGWKKYEGDAKRARSDFTVTKEGWLHIKNGPGDLQTEAQYGDFVLQLECISNGKHLNSGVFFRCRPGEYQNGYEAQIHNGFNPESPKEYTVEEYDPQTHELKDKKKVKSAALDYGTGAIYRRMPARKQMAKDGEWFALTVIADGNHFATWVNGVQVVDWTDNRPPSDNARNGCRLEKGPISLQGHDPTTDLSFRNLRIAELPAGEKK